METAHAPTLESLAEELDAQLLSGGITEPDAQQFLDALYNVAEQTGLDGTAPLPADIAASLRSRLGQLCSQL